MMAPQGLSTLARRTMGAPSAAVFAVGSSAPMVVVVGAIPAMYGKTEVLGVPLGYAVVAAVLGLLASGHVSMSSHLKHPAPFFANLAVGFGSRIGPAVGMAGAVIALVSYNCIQVSLYGLVGATFAPMVGGTWLEWAWGTWLLVALLGWAGGVFAARLLGFLLLFELAIIVIFVLTGLAHADPATPVATGLVPSHLLQVGAAGVLTFNMASFVGVESPAAFAEEGRPKAVRRAITVALTLTGVLYVLASMAYEDWLGAGHVAADSADPAKAPMELLGAVFGSSATAMGTLFLGTSALTSLVAFHATVARYVFGMAREGLVPARLERVSKSGEWWRGGAPTGGSLLQSGIAAVLLLGFKLFGADPIKFVFTGLSAVAAVGIFTLLAATAPACLLWWYANPDAPKVKWFQYIPPVLGGVLGTVLLWFMVNNLSALLSLPSGSHKGWLVIVVVVASAVAGVIWALVVRVVRPGWWHKAGKVVPTGTLTLDARLARIPVGDGPV